MASVEGQGWTDCGYPVIEQKPVWGVFFVVVTIGLQLCILSLVLAAIVKAVEEAAEEDRPSSDVSSRTQKAHDIETCEGAQENRQISERYS